MKFYKFRSLHGDGLLFALDMIVNKRIHLSTHDEMNDPDEGAFEVTDRKEIIPEIGDDEYCNQLYVVRKVIDKTRFTCFSAKADNPLLWAHYANGYSGIAVEYEIPCDSPVIDVLPIEYSGKKTEISFAAVKAIGSGSKTPYSYGILRRKRKEWAYEDEYRIYLKYSSDQYLENITPTSVILGGRNTRFNDVFIQICRKYEIKLGYLMPKECGYEIFYPNEMPK